MIPYKSKVTGKASIRATLKFAIRRKEKKVRISYSTPRPQTSVLQISPEKRKNKVFKTWMGLCAKKAIIKLFTNLEMLECRRLLSLPSGAA
jgi:hypothetical protein